MKVELLYSDGCPRYQALLPRLRQFTERAGVEAAIDLHRIESADAAVRARFLGCPTVRVDGRDVDPSAETRNDYRLKCRLYTTPVGLSGVPDDDCIMQVIERSEG